MDQNRQVEEFTELFRTQYQENISAAVMKGYRSVVLNFMDIAMFSSELSETLLLDPEETLKSARAAVQQIDLPVEQIPEINIRLKGLPCTQQISLRHIRTEHTGKLMSFEGVVRQKSYVRPQVTKSRYECPSCGNIIPVLQLDKQVKEPTRCGCGRKGKFKCIYSEKQDVQYIILEESLEDIESNEQPHRRRVFMQSDLTHPEVDSKLPPGTKVRVTGFLKEVPIIMKSGAQSTEFDLMIEANNVEPQEEDITEMVVNDEDKERIREEASSDRFFDNVIKSMAPSIYGHELIKKALLLQMIGGKKRIRKDGTRVRGDIHIFLIGDPGSAKSQLLKRVDCLAPKSRFFSGKGASGPGLTASVTKDEYLGVWGLEAGAIVLADKGILCLDELDKIATSDTSALHEAMEGGTVPIAKANIHTTLRSETTVLAAANPKDGSFNPYKETFAEQFDIPQTLINRFDLVFPVKDTPDENRDAEMAEFLLDIEGSEDDKEPFYDNEFMRKYIAFAKRIEPVMTKEAGDVIIEYYTRIRNSMSNGNGSKRVPVNARILEGLQRLTEAYAKARLSEQGEKQDAENAIYMFHNAYAETHGTNEQGIPEYMKLDTGMKSSDKEKYQKFDALASNMFRRTKGKIAWEDLVEAAKDKGIEEQKATEFIEKKIKEKEIYEPVSGFLKELR